MTIEWFATSHGPCLANQPEYVGRTDPPGLPRAKPADHLFAPLYVPLSNQIERRPSDARILIGLDQI